MEKLSLAVRQYERLISSVAKDDFGVPKKVMVWLQEDALPAIRELSVRPSFQENARWALDTLVAGTGTVERTAIDRLCTALQVYARALVASRSARRNSRNSGRVGAPLPLAIQQEADDHQRIMAQVAEIADGRLEDLVNPEDYFEPASRFTELEDGTRVQNAETIAAFNPELLPIGDFILRRLNQRVNVRMAPLDRLRRTSGQRTGRGRQTNAALDTYWQDLCSARDELKALLEAPGTLAIRDASIVAVQVLNAFGGTATSQWLGVSDELASRGKHLLLHRLTGRQGWDVADRIAAALRRLHEHYSSLPPADVEREHEIATRRVVLDLGTKEVFWQHKPLGTRLTGQSWKLLVALISQRRRGRAATVRDVYGEKDVMDSALGTLVHRLKKKLPPALAEKIVAHGTAEYYLDIPPQEIVILPTKTQKPAS